MHEGDIIAGKYRVDRVLGKGGMGVVVAATHLQLGELVAIKLLRPQALHQDEMVTRFLREGSTLARLRSEHVARVHDVGTLDNGCPYLVMEFLDGLDLAAVLRERGPLDAQSVVEYALQACEALAEAHGMGVVHRDLKPANLFVIHRPDGTPSIKIIDFGISKLMATEQSDMGITHSAVTMGSPRYMSPEQMTSARDVDVRADVWALGAILYHLLTGNPPFNGRSMVEIFVQTCEGPPSMRAARPELPEGLEAVVLRCLRREREERYADVAELAAALQPFGPPLSHVHADRAARILQAPPSSMRGRSVHPRADGPRSARAPRSSSAAPPDGWTHANASEQDARRREAPTLPTSPQPVLRAAHGAPDGEALGFEEAVQSALVELGGEGRLVLAGSVLELRGAEKTAAVDVERLAARWPRLERDARRREALGVVARLARDLGTAAAPPAEVSVRRPPTRVGVVAGLVSVALAGLGTFVLSQQRAQPQVLAVEERTREAQRPRLEEACRASRQRIQSGAVIGPFDAVGWEADVWLARRSGGPPIAASLGDIAVDGRLAPALEKVLDRVDDGTVVIKGGERAGALGGSAVVVTLGDGYARAFFDPEGQPRLIALAERLYRSTGADLGALYARCASLDVHDVGAWFRGRDTRDAATALLMQVGARAERLRAAPGALPPGAPAEAETLGAAMAAAALDDRALVRLLGELGGSVAAASEGTSVTFPVKAPLRATIVSRGLLDRMGLSP